MAIPLFFWSSQITFCKITCGETNQGENLHCGVTKLSITYNMMHYEGVPASSYYVIAEVASVQIIFRATVWPKLLIFCLCTSSSKEKLHWKAVTRIEKLSGDELVQRQNMSKCSIGCSLSLELSKTWHSCGSQPQLNLVINEATLTMFWKCCWVVL